MFILKSTHERILRVVTAAADEVIQELAAQRNELSLELSRYREQRDAANKRKWDAWDATKVAK